MSASSPAADVALSPRTVGASVAALAGLNFFLADVRDGLGPFLGVFLVEQGWKADAIGLVMMVGGLAGMVATTSPDSTSNCATRRGLGGVIGGKELKGRSGFS